MTDKQYFLQGAVCLIQATSSGECKLRQLQMHGCGIADMAFVHDAIQRRAAEALANAKQPKKKKAKKKKKKGAQEKPPGEPMNRSYAQLRFGSSERLLCRGTRGAKGSDLMMHAELADFCPCSGSS